MKTTTDLEKRISQIESRNKKVELEKEWETSLIRKLSITILTYLLLASYFSLVLKVNPWINAIVPTAGFVFSTLSLSFIKNIWIKKRQ